ncbi:hypothetical protein As57867_003753, partial [Aphanomyces stellatus]
MRANRVRAASSLSDGVLVPLNPSPNHLHAAVAGLYIGLSLLASTLYLHLVDPVFSNDILWINYSPNRDQALLIDLFNRGLVTVESNASTVAFDLLAPSASMDKSYVTESTTTEVSPTYARRLILAPLSPLFAITNLRRLSPTWVFNMYSQYCWLDFGHVWEMAHTDARQARCDARYSANAAVAMESILRNQVWADFELNYGGDSGSFRITVQVYLESMVPQGPAWLAATSTALTTFSIDQEVAYWEANNVTYFQLQWHNQYQVGIADTFQIQNALGLVQAITLKKLAKTDEIWTSTNLFWTEYFDQALAFTYNQSLIRSAPNYWTKPPNPYDLEGGAGLFDVGTGDYINQARVFRAVIGPFMSVDLFYIQVPVELTQLYMAFQSMLFGAWSEDHSGLLESIPSVNMQPMPATWQGQVFGGGNPMCIFQPATPYVQQLFSFYDACGVTVPFSLTLTMYSSVFAAVMISSALDVHTTCQLVATNSRECLVHVKNVVQVASTVGLLRPQTLQLSILKTHTLVASLDISIVQFAAVAPVLNWTMLTQPLLHDTSFAFFGWALLYDWVQGDREVVSFQGDAGTLVLISDTQPTISYPSSTKYIGASLWIIFWLMIYATAILCAVYCFCCLWLVHIRFDMEAINLIWFNHLASSIWVGRPLLYVRGMTAILVLSSSQLEIASTSTRSQFVFSPRSLFLTMLVAGEATWIVYVIADCCTIATGRSTRANAVLSLILGWLTLVVLERTNPVLPIATFDRSCSTVNMDQAIRCASGLVQIGNPTRIVVIVILLGSAFLLGTLVTQVFSRWARRPLPTPPRHLLGVGDVYLTTHDTASSSLESMWVMDKVSCIMIGLVPFHWRTRSYIFDVKLWLIHKHMTSTSHASGVTFASQGRHRRNLVVHVLPPSMPPKASLWQHPSIQCLKSTLGVAYVIVSIVGSVSYLKLSRVNLANDMLWANFNMTGAHAFFANWLNQELLLGVHNATMQLTQETINMDGTFDATNAVVQFAANYGAQMQHTDLATVEASVAGLRVTDPCLVPWIFTQYCFVDFNRRWELANSATRLRRCQQHMTTNGAVYLESMLRNIDFSVFQTCWGHAFDVAVGQELSRSDAGQAWMKN